MAACWRSCVWNDTLTLRGSGASNKRGMHTIGASVEFRRCPQQLHQQHHTPSLGHDPEFRCVPAPRARSEPKPSPQSAQNPDPTADTPRLQLSPRSHPSSTPQIWIKQSWRACKRQCALVCTPILSWNCLGRQAVISLEVSIANLCVYRVSKLLVLYF